MTNHHNFNRNPSKISARPCPNSASDAHKKMNAAIPTLSDQQKRKALAEINLSPNGALCRAARYHADRIQIDAEDLLHDAVLRALTSRKWPSHLNAEQFLNGVMKSIASALVARREAGTDVLDGAMLLEKIGQLETLLTPLAVVERTARAYKCEEALSAICEGRPKLTMVLDGIGQGLIGRHLAAFADVDQTELATIRRMLQRRSAVEMKKLIEATS